VLHSEVEATLILARQQNSSPPLPAKSFFHDSTKPNAIVFYHGTVFNSQLGSKL